MNASRIHQALLAMQALVFGVPISFLALLGLPFEPICGSDVPWIAATISAIGCFSILALAAFWYLFITCLTYGPHKLRSVSAIGWILAAMGCIISLSALASYHLSDYMPYSDFWYFRLELSWFRFGCPLTISVLHLAGLAWWTRHQLAESQYQ